MDRRIVTPARCRTHSLELRVLRPALSPELSALPDAELWHTLDQHLRREMSPEEVENFWNRVGTVASGALAGAAPGAATGAAFGPYGALIGAGIGAVTGGISAATQPRSTPRGRVPARPAAPRAPAAPVAPAAVPLATPAPGAEPVAVASGVASPSAPASALPPTAPTSTPATATLLDPAVLGALAQALLPILLQQLGRRDGVELGLSGQRVSARAALDTLAVLVERARIEADLVLGRDLGSQLMARGPLGDFVSEPEGADARAARVLDAIAEQRRLLDLSGSALGRDIIAPLPGSPSNLVRFRAGVSNTRAFPHSAICQLRMQMSEGNGAWFIGTGFYVGSGLILTAGHNVFHARYGRATRMIVTPGRQSLMVRPFASFEITSAQMHAHPEWAPRPTRADHDLAVLTVGTGAPGGRWFELREDDVTRGADLTVCGYAADVDSGVDPNEQNMDTDTVRTRTRDTITYSLHTTGGTSGSPAYIEVSGRVCAVGVHSRTHDRHTNAGCRLTRAKLAWVESLVRHVPDYLEARAQIDPQVLHLLDAPDERERTTSGVSLDQFGSLEELFELQQPGMSRVRPTGGRPS